MRPAATPYFSRIALIAGVLFPAAATWTIGHQAQTGDATGLERQVSAPPAAPRGGACTNLTYDNFAMNFFESYCTRCHSSELFGADRNGAPPGLNWDVLEIVLANLDRIHVRAVQLQTMPPSAPFPSVNERAMLGEWIDFGAPVNDGDIGCDDGQFCNGVETCLSNACQPGSPADCNDSADCTVDSCNQTTDSCDNVPDDAFCDNGAFCDGAETCDPVNDCQPGTPPDCDDGIDCTIGTCDAIADACDNQPDDGACPDDGQFCNGDEVCNPDLDCISTGDPCNAGELCDEQDDECVPLDCSDDGECDDGQFCNGHETCNLTTGTCEAGTDVDCDDAMGCTADSCNETTDSCDNIPDDVFCDNGVFCDGAETCDPVKDCQSGTAVDCDDGVDCTVDSCNETTDSCDNDADNSLCDNTIFCDGAETCDPLNGCQPGTPPDCDDGIDCTIDTCDAIADRDADGIPDEDDNCPDAANSDQSDRDADGFGSVCDTCPLFMNQNQVDSDGDGAGDVCDGDRDGDGTANSDDNCVDVPNSDQSDTDLDGTGDMCDICPHSFNPDQADSDGDLVGDECDNCVGVPNTDQVDSDGDGIGDACPEPEVGQTLPEVVEESDEPANATGRRGAASSSMCGLLNSVSLLSISVVLGAWKVRRWRSFWHELRSLN